MQAQCYLMTIFLWVLKGHSYPSCTLWGYQSPRQHCLAHMNMPAWQMQHLVMVTKKVPAPVQSTMWKQASSPCLTESKVAKQKNDLLEVTKQVGGRASNKYNPDVLDSTSSLHRADSLSSMLEGNVLHLLIPPFPLSIEIEAGIWLPKPWILQWFPRLAVKSANISIESSPNGQLKLISLPTSLSVQNSSKHILLLYRYALYISISWFCKEPLITKILLLQLSQWIDWSTTIKKIKILHHDFCK